MMGWISLKEQSLIDFDDGSISGSSMVSNDGPIDGSHCISHHYDMEPSMGSIDGMEMMMPPTMGVIVLDINMMKRY